MRFGFNFENDTGNALTKIYPGVYFFILSLVTLLCSEATPISKMRDIAFNFRAYSFLLLFYVLIIFYIILRNGPSGIAPIINTHLPVPICAIIFSLASKRYTDFVIKAIIAAAVLNSLSGILESVFRFRIFPYDERWVVLHEDHFRASAMMGHPLSNALFTTVMIPMTAGMRLPPAIKAIVLVILLLSLVAFGGRAGLGISLLSLIPLAFVALKNSRKTMTLQKVFLIGFVIFIVPACIATGAYFALNSSMGERLQAHNSLDDESALNRLYSFKVLEIMDTSQLLFGVSLQESTRIIYRLGYGYPVSDIENPWLIMLMLLGGIQFLVWLSATLAFVLCMMKNASFEIKLAIICYFVTASFANSFGRQESVYTLLVVAVICAKRFLHDTVAPHTSLPVRSP